MDRIPAPILKIADRGGQAAVDEGYQAMGEWEGLGEDQEPSVQRG